MIHIELNTIDWNAISAIATTLALIAAFLTIIVSNNQERKNRKLQVLLLHKDQQQKQLDEMVTNLLTIIDDINPLHLTNYSKKIEDRTITVQDRELLDKIASVDQSNYNKLQVQVIKFSNYTEAQSMLEHLGIIREDYGTWIRSVATLLFYLEENRLVQTKMVNIFKPMADDIINKCITIDTNYIPFVKEYQKNMESDILGGFMNLLSLYSFLCTEKLLNEKKIFMEKLRTFVTKEQTRINNITNIDL